MTVLAQGSVTDRPWGMTLGALGLRGLSGQVAIHSDGKQYVVAFSEGVVIGAFSPLASDAAVRLALTQNLITSTQVGEITRRMAAEGGPGHNEVDLLIDILRLQPDQAARLRRRMVAQRAARTFTPNQGEFVVEDVIQIPLPMNVELDVRTVIYLGAKTNLAEDRLVREVAAWGAYFEIKPEAIEDVPQFGLSSTERPVVDMLIEGSYLDEMIAAHPAVGDRVIRAIVYSLGSCGALTLGAPPRSPRAMTPTQAPTFQQQRAATPSSMPRTQTPSSSPMVGRTLTPMRNAPPGQPVMPRTSTGNAPPAVSRTPTGAPPTVPRTPTGNTVPPAFSTTGSGAIPRLAASQQGSGSIPVTRPRTPSTPPPGTENVQPRAKRESMQPEFSTAPARPFKAPSTPPPPTVPLDAPTAAGKRSTGAGVGPRRARRDSTAVNEIEQLLASKIPLLDKGVDHFTLLGLSNDATPEHVRSAYFTLARKLHPDRLSAIGVDDEARRAQRLMAQVNLAFAVLNDPAKRAEYATIVARGGEAVVKAQEAKADEMAMRIMRAEEAFKQGEMALRRDQLKQALDSFQMASELQPKESEYQALLAWTKFAMATDKQAVAGATRKALVIAAEANDRSPTALFYLGRVERMLGREKEALQHFQDVLAIKPSHTEAASEARILSQRLNKR